MPAKMYQCLLLLSDWPSLQIGLRVLIWLRKMLTYCYTISFILIQLLNELSNPFHLKYRLSIAFSVDPFFNSESYLAGLLQFRFIECSNNLSTVEIINNVCPWVCISYLLDHKDFLIVIWSVNFRENVLIF